jgi:hypothetical protein
VPIEPLPIPAMGPDATGMGPRQWLTHGRKAVFGPLGTADAQGATGDQSQFNPGILRSDDQDMMGRAQCALRPNAC